jgi:hypothetical protein
VSRRGGGRSGEEKECLVFMSNVTRTLCAAGRHTVKIMVLILATHLSAMPEPTAAQFTCEESQRMLFQLMHTTNLSVSLPVALPVCLTVGLQDRNLGNA